MGSEAKLREYLKRVTTELQTIRDREREPIAVIGIGCRYPGGIVDAASFWRALADGVDAITEVPPERWDAEALYDPDPDAPGKSIVRAGGFLDDIDRFDAGFFGISPAEAVRMDPQQRLLLEVGFEAFEHAGIPAETLAGSDTGVFVGLMYHDYELLQSGALEQLDGYVGTGTAASVASGRISYSFGLHGPSVTIDTACSSSLVAVHMACQSLRAGECQTALAGGVALMLTPTLFVEFSRVRGVSRDGRCRSFDAAADGVGWSEGCGLIVLKRLSDAERAGDRVLGVIHGSAVNQDGRSNGLTAPNGPSQQAVVRQALARSGLRASDVSYVEAHGTGTALGDPIELEALGAAYRERRDPLLVGSIKSNLGHTQAAAGVAGVIKAVLSIANETIPPNLHFTAPTPHVRWDELPLAVPTAPRPWPRGALPRYAGVSSFGISGTNAHVIVGEAPAREVPPPSASRGHHLVPVSARSVEALRAAADGLARRLTDASPPEVAAIVATASMRRSHHPVRIAVVGANGPDLATRLREAVEHAHRRPVAPGRLAFVFPGQGGQWVGMGRGLLASEPVFRQTIEACDEAMASYAPWTGPHAPASLAELITEGALESVEAIQPAIFAMQVALSALFRSWGVEPDGVVGHSMGEIAAAHVAGLLSLDDACRLSCVRSRAVRTTSGRGAMAVVELSADDAAAVIADVADDVAIAAHNGPRTTVLSGTKDALRCVLTRLTEQGVFNRWIKVDYASHGPQMDALRDALDGVVPASGAPETIGFYSTVEGDRVGHALSGEYWWHNLRRPVRFWPAVQALVRDGYDTFIEISPHPVLTASLEDGLGGGAIVIPAMRRDQPGSADPLAALGRLYMSGRTVKWRALYPDGAALTDLPRYPWHRQRYWIQSPGPGVAVTASRSADPPLHDAVRAPSWQLAPLDSTSHPPNGVIVVFEDGQGVATGLATELERRGTPVATIGESRAGWQASQYLESLRNALQGRPCAAIVWLGALDGKDELGGSIEWAMREGAFGAVLVAQAAIELGARSRLYLVTRGAQAAGSAVTAPAQAMLWGLGRTLRLEHPELSCSQIDLEPASDPRELDALADEVVGGSRESQVALRGGRRWVARLRGVALEPPQMAMIRTDRTYLVSGGLGGLGIALARWLVARGARSLMLMGRRDPGPDAVCAIDDLRAAGAQIHVRRADVTRFDEVAALVDETRTSLPTLAGVFHTAATIAAPRRVVELSSADEFVDEVRSKVVGALALHDATRELPLDCFVLYSSIAGAVGSPGHAAYAASNAFLDALAEHRVAQGLPALSVQWGQFGDAGVGRDPARLAALARQGIAPITHAEAMRCVDRLLPGTTPVAMVARVDVAKLASAHGVAALDEVADVECQPDPGHASPGHGSLQGLDPRGRQDAVRGTIRRRLAELLHRAAAELDDDRPFRDYGFDSLAGLQLRNALVVAYGVTLSMADVVTHDRIASLAELILSRISGTAAPPERAAVTAAPAAPAGWVVTLRPNPDAKLRLFCFPFAGGGAPLFSEWPAALPDEVEVCAIQPPGRYERLHEAPLGSVEEMADALLPALLPYLDRAFVFAGHCFGTMVMLECMRRLDREHDLRPVLAIVSAAAAPERYLAPTLTGDHELFRRRIASIGFAEPTVLEDTDVQRTLLPAVIADFEAAARFCYTPGGPIDVPIVALAGERDFFAPPDQVERWRAHTTRWFELHRFEGEHYFIVGERAAVLDVIRSKLRDRVAVLQARGREGRWLVSAGREHASPTSRVFVFPGLGADTVDLSALARAVGPEVELVAVQRPGRGARGDEAPLARVDEIVTHLMPSLARSLDLPFSFLGADLGGLIAFEAARELRRRGLQLPHRLVVCGAMAPHVTYLHPLDRIASDRFFTLLTAFGAIRDDEPRDRELALRAECEAAAGYRYVAEPPLPVEIHTALGDRDSFVPRHGVLAWRHHSEHGATHTDLPGEHDQLRRVSPELARYLASLLCHAIEDAA